MRRCLAIAVALVLSSQLAFATSRHWVDGNRLYKECKKHSAFCVGYLLALADTIQKGQGIVRTEAMVCFPEGTVAGQFFDLAIKELTDQPQNRANPASYIVIEAFHRAWPCPR
jgi:Rap1a immunity proteins